MTEKSKRVRRGNIWEGQPWPPMGTAPLHFKKEYEKWYAWHQQRETHNWYGHMVVMIYDSRDADTQRI